MDNSSLNQCQGVWHLPDRNRAAALLVSLVLLGFPATACGLLLKSLGFQWLALVLWAGASVGAFVLYSVWSKAAKESVLTRRLHVERSSDHWLIGELNWLDRLRFLPIRDRRGAASLCCVVCVVLAMLGYIVLLAIMSASAAPAWMPFVLLWVSQFVAFKVFRQWMRVSEREWEREGGDMTALATADSDQ